MFKIEVTRTGLVQPREKKEGGMGEVASRQLGILVI